MTTKTSFREAFNYSLFVNIFAGMVKIYPAGEDTFPPAESSNYYDLRCC